jgi:hypothetical protein
VALVLCSLTITSIEDDDKRDGDDSRHIMHVRRLGERVS